MTLNLGFGLKEKQTEPDLHISTLVQACLPAEPIDRTAQQSEVSTQLQFL